MSMYGWHGQVSNQALSYRHGTKPLEQTELATPARPRVSSDERSRLRAFLGAMCLFLATLEYLIPKPLPFFRLGLANLPILLSLAVLSPREILVLMLIKALGQGLVNGTLASYVFLFSLAGSLASGSVMILAHRLGGGRISLIGVSMAGALASNVVQLTLSIAFVFGPAAWSIAPLLLGAGTLSGALMGVFARRFARRSAWYATLKARFNA